MSQQQKKQHDAVEITFLSDEEVRKQGGQGVFDAPGLEVLSKLFDEKEIGELQKLERKILEWIRIDPRHAAAYLYDPFGCLERHVGLDQGSALTAKLRELGEAAREATASAALAGPQKLVVR